MPRSPSFSSPTSTPRRLGRRCRRHRPRRALDAMSWRRGPRADCRRATAAELHRRRGHPQPAYVNKRGSQSTRSAGRGTASTWSAAADVWHAFSGEPLPLSPGEEQQAHRARRSSSMSFMPSPRTSVNSTNRLRRRCCGGLGRRRGLAGALQGEAMPSQLVHRGQHAAPAPAARPDVTDALWAGSVNALNDAGGLALERAGRRLLRARGGTRACDASRPRACRGARHHLAEQRWLAQSGWPTALVRRARRRAALPRREARPCQ